MTLVYKIGILFISLLIAIIPAFLIVNNNVVDANGWVVYFAITVVVIPFVYLYQKSSSACPACKKPWVAETNGQETISEYPVTKTEYEGYDDNRRQVVNTYIHRKYWQFMKCSDCSHTWKYQSESKSKA